jgi:hypothetical protein
MDEFPPITAVRFKGKCLELCDEVHDRKRSCIVIAQREKPYTKLIPIDEKEEPFHGCLSGLTTYSGDLTEPTRGDWEALHD